MAEERRLRLGIFGGTFDPVHIGHLVAAVNTRHALSLDKVLMVVANEPWQKSAHHEVTPALDRLAMVEAAVEGIEGVEASAIEIERGGVSYTIDTVEELHDYYAGAELFLVVGADVALELPTWERVEDLSGLVILAVVNRPGHPRVKSVPGWQVCTVDIPAIDLSSTEVREWAAAGRPLDFLVPSPVIRCINDRGLYREENSSISQQPGS